MDIVVKTYFGLEPYLEQELDHLGASRIKRGNRMVSCSGNQELLYRINFHSRLATSVLMPLVRFEASCPDELYQKVFEVPWNTWLDQRRTFSIKPVVHSQVFSHSRFAALRMKDAIADRFRKESGRRPSVDTRHPDLLFNLYINNRQVSISLDSSGEVLARRGYRKYHTEAPISEVLAAGMLHIAGFDGTKPLSDPMCGSGTIAIEAALKAARIAPGLLRRDFGFRHWKDYNEVLYEKIREEALKMRRTPGKPIRASDMSARAIRMARKNVAEAKVGEWVKLQVSDFREVMPGGQGMTLMMNPPYGERLNQNARKEFYEEIGNHLKRQWTGSSAWIISADKMLMKNIGLKPEQKHRLFNGPLECHFWKFTLY